MRQHKYRAWNSTSKQMLSWRDIGLQEMNEEISTHALINGEYANLTAMQYTGKKDVNETEIYQDDLWEYCGVAYIVDWDDMEAKFYFKNPHENATWDDHIAIEYSFEGRIVGNIHQHKNLLEPNP